MYTTDIYIIYDYLIKNIYTDTETFILLYLFNIISVLICK